MTEEEKVFCEDRSRTLLMKSVDQREARVKLDAAMQAVINKSASDVIKVRVFYCKRECKCFHRMKIRELVSKRLQFFHAPLTIAVSLSLLLSPSLSIPLILCPPLYITVSLPLSPSLTLPLRISFYVSVTLSHCLSRSRLVCLLSFRSVFLTDCHNPF